MLIKIRDLFDPGSGMENVGYGSATLPTTIHTVIIVMFGTQNKHVPLHCSYTPTSSRKFIS
jgi:hypothetical protein